MKPISPDEISAIHLLSQENQNKLANRLSSVGFEESNHILRRIRFYKSGASFDSFIKMLARQAKASDATKSKKRREKESQASAENATFALESVSNDDGKFHIEPTDNCAQNAITDAEILLICKIIETMPERRIRHLRRVWIERHEIPSVVLNTIKEHGGNPACLKEVLEERMSKKPTDSSLVT